nr:hypothetical protein [Tanacetum cinerariifolium]
ALVPHAQRLRIRRSNFRLLSNIKSKESTLQLVYDVLRICLFFKAFLVTSDAPEIYIQEFWATATVHHHAIRFKMDNKKHIVNLESFKDMLHICPRVHEHKNHKKSNEMYYPRFTKAIIHHFMSKDLSIPRRNKVHWNYVRDDHMFSTIKLVSRHQNTQQFGAAPPKPKDSARRTRSSSDTSTTPPTTAASPRLTASAKGKQTSKASKAKTLSALSKVAMTGAQQLKLVTKRSMQQTHISQASGSGADEGTGSIPGVPDAPTDESGEELSWNSTDDEGVDDEGKDGDDNEEDEGDDGEEGDGDNCANDEGKDGGDDEEDEGNDGEEGDGDDDDEGDDGEEGNDDDDQEVKRDDDKDDAEEDTRFDQEVSVAIYKLDYIYLYGFFLNRIMDTTIEQQAAMNEAFVPHAQRLRIGRSNFRLLSDIISKESTLQLVYDVLRICLFFKAFLVTADVPEIYMQEFWATSTVHHHAILFKMDNKKHIVNLESFRDMLHICPRVHGQYFDEPPFEERTRSSSDTSITPPTVAASPRLTAYAKGKQTAKASKAKSLSALSKVAMTEAQQLKLVTKRSMQQMHISQASGSGADEGTVERDDDKDDEEEGGDDDQEFDEEEYAEETRDEESFDHILKTPENSDDEGNGDEDLGLNVGGEEGHVEEEEEDELYIDVNINQGRGLQTSLKVEDSHVTLTSVNPNDTLTSKLLAGPTHEQMKGSCKSLVELEYHLEEFFKATTDQLDWVNPEAQKENEEFLKTVDENMQKIIKEQVKEQVKVQVSKILPRIEQVVNEQLEAEVLTRSSHSLKTSYSIQRSDEQRNLYNALVEAYESDKIILDTYRETVTLKRRRDDDADKDEEPSVGPNRGSKRGREGKEPESTSAPMETATRSAGRSTQASRSRQASASESALTEEPMQTTSQMEEPSHLEFDTGAEDQPI